jgi:hypothetical protein
MNKFLIILLICAFYFGADAQEVPTTEPYGKVNQADLEMKGCDFERDANAEILFDKASVVGEGIGRRTTLPMERHVRIKIFNEFGKNMANVRIIYYSYLEGVVISDLKAETINLVDGKQEITPLDKKSVYTETIDKLHSALVFAFPNVKPGSVIEYKYRVTSGAFPTWYFQNYIPTRYSEIDLNIPGTINTSTNPDRNTPLGVNFKSIPHVKQPYAKSVGETTDNYQIRAMSNIHSMPNEPYTGSRDNNLQRIEYIGINTYVSTWPKIGDILMKSNDFGYDLDRGLNNESEIIKKAKSLTFNDEKIAYIFDEVKNSMKWDKSLVFYTVDGTVKAWDKKLGNSAEINMIVYHLLKKAGIKAYPLVVCTKNNGKINPSDPTIYLFNNTVVYVPVDSTKTYVLDASNKFNLYNTVPANVLNSFGLSIDPRNDLSLDPGNKDFKMVFISNDEPAMQSVSLNAEIKSNGKMEGSTEITSYSYNKIKALRLYDTVGEEKYLDTLRLKDNNLKIFSFKLENAQVDSLPLSQKFNFSLDLSGSDGNYIYFNTNLFNSMGKNPLLNDERYSDIDFGYFDNHAVYGVYKIPAGYKTDALPKSISIVTPDQSIIFKRTIAEDDGTILVKYVLNHKKTIYFRENYPELHEFYKKMYELLNEQIVLKKS